jgi:steroid 5-alpha reductase family enzyme
MVDSGAFDPVGFDWNSYFAGLVVMLAMGVVTWIVSLRKRDVSIVDSLWSLMFLGAAIVYFVSAQAVGERGLLVLTLVAAWAVRLAAYITWRNWGEGEDHRYQKIRARNEPGFAFKSLYLVFALQAMIAWIISLPLLVAIDSPAPLGWLDLVGVVLFLAGFLFEAIGDWQLARFKRDPGNAGKVLDTGLWRYTRHPNYFGNACLWWGLFAFAWSAGGWWSVVSPLLMTLLLLKVSGVSLLESDITERRPKYRDYKERTSAFIPWPPKKGASAS